MKKSVAVWGTGNVGRPAIRAVHSHRGLELASVIVANPAKVGRDAGDLAGLPSLGVAATDQPDQVLASATPYLRLFGLASGGAYLARGALGLSQKSNGDGNAADQARIAVARYVAENHLPETKGLNTIVRSGADALAQATPELIAS